MKFSIFPQIPEDSALRKTLQRNQCYPGCSLLQGDKKDLQNRSEQKSEEVGAVRVSAPGTGCSPSVSPSRCHPAATLRDPQYHGVCLRTRSRNGSPCGCGCQTPRSGLLSSICPRILSPPIHSFILSFTQSLLKEILLMNR